MEEALVKLDRRLAAAEQILQPMAKDVSGLKADVSVLWAWPRVHSDSRCVASESEATILWNPQLVIKE